MARPSEKAPAMEALCDTLLGVANARRDSITGNRCVPTPIGCGQPVGEFRNEISRKEFTISGFCQTCQDKIFGA